MRLRAKIKPTVNELNKMLVRFEAKGWHSYRDNIRERAFAFKLRQRKPKS